MFSPSRPATGQQTVLPLRPQSVASFYAEFMGALRSLGIEVKIWPMPVEIPNPIRFDRDTEHASYDPEFAYRFWLVLTRLDPSLRSFVVASLESTAPSTSSGEASTLHRPDFPGDAPPNGPEQIPSLCEAYSHEVISAGFWPGGGDVPRRRIYVYAAPEPPGFKTAPVRPRRLSTHPWGNFS